MKPITDQSLLAQLNGPRTAALGGPPGTKKISDPTVLAKLNNKYSRLGSAGVGAIDAASLGFSDEVFGVLKAATGKLTGDDRLFDAIYDEAARSARDKLEQAERDNPKSFLGGQLAGGVATLAVPGLGVSGAAARGASLLSRAHTAGKAGAKLGAAYGIGSGEGAEGRLEGGLTGAAAGYGLGAGIAPVAVGVGKAAGAIIERAKLKPMAEKLGVDRQAITTVGEAVKTDRSARGLRKGTEGDRVLDLGNQTRALAEGVAQHPGLGRDALLRSGQQQAREEGGRIRHSLDLLMGRDRGRVIDETLIDAERAAAGKLFDIARQFPSLVNSHRAATKLDKLIADADGSTRAVLENIRSFRAFEVRPGGNWVKLNELHSARQSIDDLIGSARRGGRANEARLLGQVRSEVDTVLKKVPGWQRADEAYTQAQASREALAAGRDVFKRNYGSPAELKAELRAMPRPVREWFMRGARGSISEIMGTARNDAAAVWRELYEKGWNREKMDILLPFGDAKILQKTLEAAKNRAAGREAITGNSRTSFRQVAREMVPGNISAEKIESELRKTTITGLGLEMLVATANKLTGNRVAGIINRGRAKTREGVGKLLSASDRTKISRDDVLAILAKAERAKGRALNVKEQIEAVTGAVAKASIVPAAVSAR